MFLLKNLRLENRKAEENKRKAEENKRKAEEEYNKNGMIFNLNEAKSVAKEEKLDICVISYGGSCSNKLVDVLIENNYNCRTQIWDKILCHCPYFIDLGIPIIYVYDNPIKSFLSMKNRDSTLSLTNQRKLSNNLNVEANDETLLQLIFAQFTSFINCASKNVLIIHSKELFDNDISHKLKVFLENPKLDFFPIKYKTPKTSLDNIIINNNELFKKYEEQIKFVNDYKDVIK